MYLYKFVKTMWFKVNFKLDGYYYPNKYQWSNPCWLSTNKRIQMHPGQIWILLIGPKLWREIQLLIRTRILAGSSIVRSLNDKLAHRE